MGGCGGKVEMDEQSKKIEADLRAAKQRMLREHRILMLGASESGKSTIIKQFQVLSGKFSDKARTRYRLVIPANLLECARCCMLGAAELFEKDADMTQAGAVVNNYSVAMLQQSGFPDELKNALTVIVKNSQLRELIKQNRERNSFYLPDPCEYLFDHVERIMTPEYTPTVDDCIRVRHRTTGIVETRLQVNRAIFRIIDVGGQRSERRKWVNCFYDLTSILYCVALNEYDMKLYENNNVNRMAEALKIFEDIIKFRPFQQTPLIIFFNKADLLEAKLKSVTPSYLFDDYNGSENVDDAAKFIMKKFLKIIPQGHQVYHHTTIAVDTENIKFVWNSVKDVVTSLSITQSQF